MDTNTFTMDMYSMGLVFYEVATLAHAYKPSASGDVVNAWKQAHLTCVAGDPRTRNTKLGTRLAQVIMKMVNKRPADRYPTWDAVLESLDRADEAESSELEVGRLVERALKTFNEEEKQRLEREEATQKKREYDALVRHSFREIVAAAHKIVDQFNKQCDFGKLTIEELTLAVRVKGSRGGVDISVEPVYGKSRLRKLPIKAWGRVASHTGRGFNILLVQQGADDLYGTWTTLHVKHNPLARRSDNRPEPFYFQPGELANELQHIGAMHIFVTEVCEFRPEMLLPLVEETL